LALLVVATLHTGFHFGWNIHTAAYALMCIVIASGIFGVVVYSRFPRLMTENRQSMTTGQMLGRIAGIDDDLRGVAMPLDDTTVAIIERAIETIVLDAWRLTVLKLSEKQALLERVRRDARFKAMMEVWLYLHVPLTFALIAALTAHIVAIFFM
jgi:hypothetical protein